MAVSAGCWGFNLSVAANTGSRQVEPAPSIPAAARGDLARLLGVRVDSPAPRAEALDGESRFVLVGVVSPRPALEAREGLALIAVDGKPPRVFRVNDVVDGQNVLQAVDVNHVSLGLRHGAAWAVLTLPLPAPAATGTVPVPETIRAQRIASSRHDIPPTPQQLFQERQQRQFEQEEMQNRAPATDTVQARD